MLLDALTHPFMLAVVLPVLIIAGIVALLLPEQDEVTYVFNDYKPTPADTADITQIIPRVPNPAYGHYDTFETGRVGALIGDELEKQMIARVIAHTFLYELGQKARQNNLALCA